MSVARHLSTKGTGAAASKHAHRQDYRRAGNAYFLGKGIATDLPAGAMAFLRSPYAAQLPDVQLIFISAPMTAAPYLAPFKKVMPMASRSAPHYCGRRAAVI